MIIQSVKDGHYLSFNDEKHKYILDGERVPGVTTFAKGGYPTSEALVSWMKGQTANAVWDALLKQDSDGYRPKTNIIWPLNETQRKEMVKEAKAKDKEEAEKAANIGTLTHDFALYTETKQYEKLLEVQKLIAAHPDKEKILSCTSKFTEWKKTNVDEMVASETIVASIVYQFGGKFDRLANRGNTLILSDFKTATSIYLDNYIQLGAYALAIEEWMGLQVQGLEILRFGKEDGEFQTLLVDKPEEIEIFKQQAIRCKQTYDFRKLENDKRWKWGGVKK